MLLEKFNEELQCECTSYAELVNHMYNIGKSDVYFCTIIEGAIQLLDNLKELQGAVFADIDDHSNFINEIQELNDTALFSFKLASAIYRFQIVATGKFLAIVTKLAIEQATMPIYEHLGLVEETEN